MLKPSGKIPVWQAPFGYYIAGDGMGKRAEKLKLGKQEAEIANLLTH